MSECADPLWPNSIGVYYDLGVCSCLTVQTQVKNDITTRRPEVFASLQGLVSSLSSLVERGVSVPAAPILLGIASVYANITTSISSMQEVRPQALGQR